MARDAETGRPVAGAAVRVSYPLAAPGLAPRLSSAEAGADGVARVEAAPHGEAGVLVEVTAAGYMAEQKTVSVETVAAVRPPPLFGADAPRPPAVVAELHKGPYPTVELVLPPHYRGLVKVEVVPRDDVPCPPGQRTFRYDVPASGEVRAEGPALLARVPGFRLIYADGTPLSYRGAESPVGYWLLKCEGDCRHFVVGTQGDYDEARRAERQEDSGASYATGGLGGLRGRGGRGGPPSSSAGSAGGS